MLEALLLMALPVVAEPLADARAPTKPSLELLEFLGEFGDDETGEFEEEAPPPTAGKAAAKSPPRKPSLPAPPRSGKETP